MSRQGYTRYSTTDSFARPILQRSNERQTRRKREREKKRKKRFCFYTDLGLKDIETQIFFRDNKETTSLDTTFRVHVIRTGCIYIKYIHIPLFLEIFLPTPFPLSTYPLFQIILPLTRISLSVTPR